MFNSQSAFRIGQNGDFMTNMMTMMGIMMTRQVLVRKGKANCAVTDDWGWSLLHEVRMVGRIMVVGIWMRIMWIMVLMMMMAMR